MEEKPKKKKLSEKVVEAKLKKGNQMYCPLEKVWKNEKFFLRHKRDNWFACADCGTIFMNPQHVKDILARIEKAKEGVQQQPEDSRIILPSGISVPKGVIKH